MSATAKQLAPGLIGGGKIKFAGAPRAGKGSFRPRNWRGARVGVARSVIDIMIVSGCCASDFEHAPTGPGGKGISRLFPSSLYTLDDAG